MDIADKSASAIIRPGKVPRWRLVLDGDFREYREMGEQARRPGAFGADIELVRSNSPACCGALFVSESDGRILPRQFWQLEYFFARDGSEALVFEFDRWGKHFWARRLEELQLRRK